MKRIPEGYMFLIGICLVLVETWGIVVVSDKPQKSCIQTARVVEIVEPHYHDAIVRLETGEVVTVYRDEMTIGSLYCSRWSR